MCCCKRHRTSAAVRGWDGRRSGKPAKQTSKGEQRGGKGPQSYLPGFVLQALEQWMAGKGAGKGMGSPMTNKGTSKGKGGEARSAPQVQGRAHRKEWECAFCTVPNFMARRVCRHCLVPRAPEHEPQPGTRAATTNTASRNSGKVKAPETATAPQVRVKLEAAEKVPAKVSCPSGAKAQPSMGAQ